MGAARGNTRVIRAAESLTIGRAKECGLQIQGDDGVSRFHCRLEVSPRACTIMDLESCNGTFVNNAAVSDVQLQHSDVIRCGATELHVAFEVTQSVTYCGEEPASQHNVIPRKLGGYTVGEEIGRGGMGRVFRGIAPGSGRPVAIKVICFPDTSEPLPMGLIVREAAVQSRLKHPRIVDLLDFGFEGRWPYLVFEYLQVVPLLALLAKMPPRERTRVACRVACHVLEALEFAHARGVVHRDIKPSNLLAYYDPAGKLRIKLADFGLSKDYESAGLSGITTSKEIRGTLAFMPPEQVVSSRNVGPLSDIYSVGATLYQMLSGATPFHATSTQGLLWAILNSTPTPLAAHSPHVPEALATVVHRALDPEPSKRMHSAARMRQLLRPFGQRE